MHTLEIERDAINFAWVAHYGQVRKYTGEPYFNHCLEVARIVQKYEESVPRGSVYMICAALLHDTVEDTNTTIQQIQEQFGIKVAEIVCDLTDEPKETGNRKTRKAIDRQRLFHASKEAQTVKLADLIDNTKSIVEHDPNFAVVYLREKEQLLSVLTKPDHKLIEHARSILEESKRKLTKTRSSS